MMSIEEACNVLHIDQGVNDPLIWSLINALPGYIEVATGLPALAQVDDPLVDTVSGLILTQWYYADHADDRSLTRTIDALLKAITIKARELVSNAE